MLTSCVSTNIQAPSHPDIWTLTKEQTWQLTSLNGRRIPDGSKSATLTFNPEAGILSGYATCNTYSAHYILADPRAGSEKLQFSIFNFQFSTEIQCPEGDMNAEERFLATLKKATAILIHEHSLSIYQNDKEILHFELQDF